MVQRNPWPWNESLGGIAVEGGGAYRIRRILFGMVRDRCTELGLSEGDIIRCTHRDREMVEVRLSSGCKKKLDLAYAWFIKVEPVVEQSVAG
ncbi:MAG: hypothetical protein U5R14_12585 [Gemmatimonadota bacterium]|nr:hypothetical protein [Gemmatimonadota bacterium]